MIPMKVRIPFALAALAVATLAVAKHDPRHTRHELMEDVREAAKPVGAMLRGRADFDARKLMKSLKVWEDVGSQFGDLFPEGTETGMDTKATPAVWEDREGFDAALTKWREATAAAIAAEPKTLADARPVVGPIFDTCKGCHDTYRIEDD